MKEQMQSPFPTTSSDEFKDFKFTPDVAKFKESLEDKYFTPFGIIIPPYVLKVLAAASTADDNIKPGLLERARQKAEVHYLSQWSKGNIKVKDDDATPMPDDIKQKLKALNKARTEEKRGLKERIDKISKSAQKLPVYADTIKQKDIKAKYKWIIEGSFKQDLHKQGGTCVDIKCQKCGSARTCHLGDVFQIKYCLPCKEKNAKK